MERYIKKGIRRACKFRSKMLNIGQTKEDYLNGLFIPITSEQAVFYDSNPNATFDEVLNTQITVVDMVQPTNQELYERELVCLIRDRYSLDDELRILYDGNNSAEFLKHEAFVNELKTNLKIKHNIE